MLNIGIRKTSNFFIAILLLTSCSGFYQTEDNSRFPEKTPANFQTAEPGKTTVPSAASTFSPTQILSGESPSQSSTESSISSEGRNPLPDGDLYTWREVASGLEKPIGLAHAGDGSNRLFILEQAGYIRIIRDGNLSTEIFLDISDRVGSQGFEQGLLGLAFHPDFSENGYFFIYYTDLHGDTVIARYQVMSNNLDQADPASELRLLVVKQPYRNHNGGSLVFGPDGYLYAGLGDGGSAGDPQNNAQTLSSLLGKILRIDVNQEIPYSIPPDNPFSNGGGAPEVWAYGLRNPWRFSFDRLNGDLYIGDVGQNQWEEINFLPARSPGGSNFGWRYFEGSHPYQDTPPAGFEFISPVAEYSHDLGCSVTAGVVYRGERLPEFQGIYIFGDYCSQRIWGLTRDGQSQWVSAILFSGVGSITSFGDDESGEVYLVNHEGQVLILERKK